MSSPEILRNDSRMDASCALSSSVIFGCGCNAQKDTRLVRQEQERDFSVVRSLTSKRFFVQFTELVLRKGKSVGLSEGCVCLCSCACDVQSRYALYELVRTDLFLVCYMKKGFKQKSMNKTQQVTRMHKREVPLYPNCAQQFSQFSVSTHNTNGTKTPQSDNKQNVSVSVRKTGKESKIASGQLFDNQQLIVPKNVDISTTVLAQELCCEVAIVSTNEPESRKNISSETPHHCSTQCTTDHCPLESAICEELFKNCTAPTASAV